MKTSHTKSMKTFLLILLALSLFIITTIGCGSSNSTNSGSQAGSGSGSGSNPNPTPSPAPGTPGVTRDAAFWPFSVDSPWNMPLATSAIYSTGDASDLCAKDLSDLKIVINSDKWSHPIFIASESDPEAKIYLDHSQENPPKNPSLERTILIPKNANPAAPPFNGDCANTQEGDAHLHIIDPTHHFVDEMWRASNLGNINWKACGYTRNDLYGSGIETGGERAYGGSALGGLIRKEELKKGIPHALAFALFKSNQQCLKPDMNKIPGCSALWPATQVDSWATPNSYSGNVPMGQLIAIPPNVNLASLGLSAQATIIARALQDYGAYDVDSTESKEIGFSVETGASSEVDQNLENELTTKIVPLLRCIKNNGKDSVGGALTPDTPRRAPLAPPLK